MSKTQINYRKNIARALHLEYINRKQLKKWSCWDEEEMKERQRYVEISEAKIELLKDLLKDCRR